MTELAKAMLSEYGKNKKIGMVVIGKGEGEKIHEEIMADEEVPRSIELGKLYVISPHIDYMHVFRNYKNAIRTKDPIIASSMGTHMSQKEIKRLLQEHECQEFY